MWLPAMLRFDLAVLAGAEPALETFGAFLEHSQQCFLLPFIELPTQPVEQLRFVDEDLDKRNRSPLRLYHRARRVISGFQVHNAPPAETMLRFCNNNSTRIDRR